MHTEEIPSCLEATDQFSYSAHFVSPLRLAISRRPTVALYRSRRFVQSNFLPHSRYLALCIFNPFEEPLARPEVAPGSAQNSSCNSFRPSLSIDEGKGFSEKPIGHQRGSAPIPSEQARQGSEIVRRYRLIDSLGPRVRSEARVCIGHERGGCLRYRCIQGGCGRRKHVSAPSMPDFSLPDHQVSKAIFCKCADRRYVSTMNSVFARRGLDGNNRRYPRS